MNKWKSILLLALVFFAGLGIGVVGTRLAVRRIVQQALVHPERAQVFMERNLTRKLQLSREQQVQVHAILTDTRQRLAALRKEFQPQTAAVMHETDQKITALLTPEQQTRYENLKERNWPGLRRLPPAEPPPAAPGGSQNSGEPEKN